LIEELRGPPRRSVLLVVSGAMMAHVIVIAVWAGGYWIATAVLGLGAFSGSHAEEAGGYFFFSAEAYTSLGLGDINLTGPVRVLAGMQTLTGLLLIAWSASFTFVAMQRFWDFHKERHRGKHGRRV
jgi:hypothetical protein